MLDTRLLGSTVLAVSMTLSAPVLGAQEADPGRALADGMYKTEVKVSRFNFAQVAFEKHGATVTGYADLWGPVYCFQGTLTDNAIQVDKSRARKEDDIGDKLMHPYRLLPIQSHEESMLQSFDIVGAVTPIVPHDVPPAGNIAPPGRLPSKETGWLRGCLKYYQEDTEPPCNDPELRETVPEAGQEPTYKPMITTVCRITDEPQEISGVVVPGGVCSVENVFGVMSTTAVAIAPLEKDEREQTVTHCGVLRLRSTMSPNLIRTHINQAVHQVTNITLPGHVFWAGQVVREILEVDGGVDVLTVGTGNAGELGLIRAANAGFGPGIWKDVDEELRRAFAKSMTSRTAEGFPKSELHDGTYRAREANRPVHGAILIFRKRGDHVVGTHATPYGVNCYQGTITPTEIHVGANVVRREEDFTTKVVTFGQVLESDRDYFAPLRFIPPPEPYPNPRSLLGTPPEILARDTKWLNECSRHFGLPEEEPPPCGDDTLRGALRYGKTRGEYFRSEIACRWTKTNGCTAENVFAAMLKTPNAIAAVKDSGTAVEDCGTLSVRLPGGGEGRVRMEIDTKHYIIKMYTQPGHPFFPSTIVRYVVDVDGRVDMNMEAWGPDSALKRMFDDAAAPLMWKGPNQALKDALAGKPASTKPGAAEKKQ